MPITTFNGKVTDSTIDEIVQMSGNDIRKIETVSLFKETDTISELTNGEDFIIPSEISEDELAEMIEDGQKYSDIADAHNNCVVLMVPLLRYEGKNFDIIDERFNKSIKNQFCRVNCVVINCEKYVLLCMFNDKWAYSRIGKDKIISPLKVIMNL